MQKRSLFSFPFRHKNAKMLWIIPDPEHFSSVFSLPTHASFTAVPLAMTAGAPSVMLIVA